MAICYHSFKTYVNTIDMLLCRKQVLTTHADAERDGITVPTTVAEYCVSNRTTLASKSSVDMADFYDDDYMDDDDDDDDDDDIVYEDDGDDSGNGES